MGDGMEAVSGEVHHGLVRCLDSLCKRWRLALSVPILLRTALGLPEGCQPGPELGAGIDDSHAVEVRGS